MHSSGRFLSLQFATIPGPFAVETDPDLVASRRQPTGAVDAASIGVDDAVPPGSPYPDPVCLRSSGSIVTAMAPDGTRRSAAQWP